MIFPDGLVYDKENDDIEPLFKNEFLFVFDLKSMGYKDKEKDISYFMVFQAVERKLLESGKFLVFRNKSTISYS